jgi:hydrophobe/amphiphile efflux-3 (HAE3) family protein
MVQGLIKKQLRHPGAFAIAILVIVALMFSLGVQLQLNSSLEALIPADGEFNSNARLLEQTFEGSSSLQLVYSVDDSTILSTAITDLTDPRVAEYVDNLQDILLESQYVVGVSPLELSENGYNGRMNVAVNTPDTLNGNTLVKNEINMLLDEIGNVPGMDITLTGLPLLIDRISGLLITDNLITIVLTLVFIFVFLLWYFRSLRFTLAVLFSPMISLIALAACMVLLDISITISLAAVGVLVLGLGVDYSIHIAVHYQDKRIEKKSHRQALLEVMKELFIPITASFLTTLGGFAALMIGVSPSTQDQGIVLSIAIIVIYLVSFLVFPVLLTVLAKHGRVVENKTFSKIKKFLAKLSVYQAHHPKTLLTVFGIITVIMFFGVMQVEFSTSNSNWIPDSDPLSISSRQDQYAFGDAETLLLILESQEGDLRDVQVARDVQRLASDIAQIPGVDEVITPYNSLPFNENEIYEAITTSGRLNSQFNEDYTITTIVIRSQNMEGPQGDEVGVLEQVREVVTLHPIYDTEVKFFGDEIRFEELATSLQQDAAITTVAGILIVFIVASVIYVSFAIGLIALIPILIGLVWAIGFMGYLGVPFTSLSTGIVSLVLGIGIDFSIHLVDSIKRYLRKYPLDRALTETLTGSGTSILLSSMTTFIGFMALSFSQLLGTQRLGWSLALAVISVFIVSILTVPAIMQLTQQKVKSS